MNTPGELKAIAAIDNTIAALKQDDQLTAIASAEEIQKALEEEMINIEKEIAELELLEK
jgi:hypothetical protein